MADILVNGTLKNNTESGVIAYAEQIRVNASTKQSQLNELLADRITALENESGGGSGGGSADISDLENRVSTLESGAGLSESYHNYIEGGYYEFGTGDLIYNKDYAYIDEYIPVTGGASYTFNLGKAGTMGKTSASIATYKSDKKRDTEYSCNADTREIPLHAQAAFVRLSFPLGHTDEVSILDSLGNVIWQAKRLALSTPELLNKDRLTLRNIYSVTTDLRLFFFSDIHGDNVAFERIVDMANGWGLGDHIDAVLNGGDTVLDRLADGIDWYNNLIPTLNVPLLTILGNHDANGNSATVSYESVLKPSITKLSSLIGGNLVQPTDAETNGYNYYYVDFDSHISGSTDKIRVIALDCMNADSYWDSTEEQWLQDTLSDANTKGYYVIILTHSPPIKTNISVIESNFSKAESDFTSGNWELVQSAVTDVQSFIDNEGKFICWLCGHKHEDFFINPKYGTGNNTVIYDKQPMFATRTASCAKGWAAPYRTYDKNDVFRDSFNYITVDLANSILRIIRIGKNYDSRLISKTGIEFNFSTHQVTKQW